VVEPGKHARNVAIILLLAAAVLLLAGGGTGADVVGNLLSLILLFGLAFFGYRLYMEHRVTLFDLPERQRTILYSSVGLVILAIVATSRMWNAGGPWILLWFAMIGAASYGVYAVFRSWREY
jgi:hypothetical protein